MTRLHKIILLISIASLTFLTSTNFKPDPDAVHYLSMARSFSHTHALTNLGSPQWYYAPLYPIVISPAFRLSEKPFLYISLINILTAILLTIGVYIWFKKYDPNIAPLLAALVAINIGLWDIAREARADTLFAALIVWSVILFNHSKFRILSVIPVVAACLTRQVGIFLLPGLLLSTVLPLAASRYENREPRIPRSRKRQLLLITIISLSALLTVQLLIYHDHQIAQQTHTITYTDQFREAGFSLPSQITEGLRRQSAEIGRLLIPGLWGSFNHRGQWLNANTVIYTTFSIAIFIGWIKLARKTRDPLVLMFPFYFAMFVVWPFDQGTRFTVPMLPILFASLWMLISSWKHAAATMMILFIIHLPISIGYLVHDRTIVAKQNQDWPTLEKITAEIGNDSFAVVNLPLHRRLMLTYLLDHPMSKTTAPIYIIAAPTTPIPAEYDPIYQDRFAMLLKSKNK